MLGFSLHDAWVAALAVSTMLFIQFFVPGLQPTPRVPDVSYKAHPSMLQTHVEFFDRNHDGIISVPETFESLNRLGLDWRGNFMRTLTINGGLAVKAFVATLPPTPKGTLSPFVWARFVAHFLTFDWQLRVPIQTIHAMKHPSDSGAYDEQGRFVEEKFERLFTFDKGHKGGLTLDELESFIDANNNPRHDPGNFGSKFEWHAAYDLLHDRHGVMRWTKLLEMYNGSLWEKVERAVAAKNAAGQGLQDLQPAILETRRA